MYNSLNSESLYFTEQGLSLPQYISYGFYSDRPKKLILLVLIIFVPISIKISIFFGIFLTVFGLFIYVLNLVYLYARGRNKVIQPDLLNKAKLKKDKISIFRGGPHVLHLKIGRLRYFRFCYKDIEKLNDIEAYLASKLIA